jgi:hypothetical protein
VSRGRRLQPVRNFPADDVPKIKVNEAKAKEVLYEALGKMTSVLRPWVKDFHVAQLTRRSAAK